MVYRVHEVSWDSPEADAARSIRMAVFVQEQNVPAELELDDIDAAAVHVVAYAPTGHAVGTGRIFADPARPGVAKIGRMAVLPEARGTGCGAALLTRLLQVARQRGYAQARLSAQVHAVGFYEKYGFTTEGAVYDDAGIPHRDMILRF